MDTHALLSPHWYRIAALRPQLRAGIGITHQRVRGERWVVLTDPLSGRHHRFNAQAWALVSRCDGQRSIDDLWAQRVDADGDEAPSQAEAIEVFGQAFAANLLAAELPGDARAAMNLRQRQRQRERQSALHPLSFKVPLWNPDALLTRHAHRLAPLCGPTAWRLAAVVALLGAALLVAQAPAFFGYARSRLGEGHLLLAMWLAYPLIKLVHEFAHAIVVKTGGGAVPELGVTLIFLTPVPYVDASASAAFPERRDRMAVGAAGMAAEVVLGSLALLAWTLLEDGLPRDIAFVTALIGGLSTLLVNGNPLLRFDGYHVLCDAFELPNLGPRSGRWWREAAQRLMFGVGGPAASSGGAGLLPARGERPWLWAYAPLSWAWRTALLVGLALLAARWSAAAGLAVLALAAWTSLLKPLGQALWWLADAPVLQGRRTRATAVAATLLLGGASAIFALPLPHRSHAAAVVSLPDEALVRPGVEGFVATVLAADGEKVQAGTPLLVLDNEPLRLELARVAREMDEARLERDSAFASDALRWGQAADRLQGLAAEHARLSARVAALEVRAGVDGRFVLDARRLRAGQFVRQGETVAQVLPPGGRLVRALVAGEQIDAVRQARGPIDVVLAHEGGLAHAARLERELPQASHELPSAALGEAAGGPFALHPGDTDGRLAAEARFALDLRLPEGVAAPIGERALVSFDLGRAPLAEHIGRFLRRSFLRHLAQ